MFSSLIGRRVFSTSASLKQREQFDKGRMGRLVLYNKRHLRVHKKMLFKKFQEPNGFPDIPVHNYGCRGTGLRHAGQWEAVPEMVPELVVPTDMEDCKLKPYVSYTAREITQEELTSKDLFNVIYGRKILQDFKEGKLDAEGNPTEPSEEEAMTAEEARIKARRTGSDIFTGGAPISKLWNVRWRYSDS